ncbi:c-type cytochrome [Reichenbachiella ulvae]|uniref:SprB repeat-containing protein n=1 Tax=Reichenbachiella ulvae TaxID=2980104 RepID=A0ABT3CSB0_9BACT|nr:hypothetical protein [Reichenbachiella ulvae]MCV9386568.1 hypothetical protein [Reichenbachiella ulvae]
MLKLKLLLSAFAFLFLISSCDEGSDEIDCTLSDLKASIVSQGIETCEEGATVEFAAEGGVAPYEYSISAVSFKTSPIFQNLTSGNYTLTVRDENQCMITMPFSVDSDIPNINVTANVTQDAGCGGAAGMVDVASSGGTGEYVYQIDGNDFGSGPTLSNVPNGNHTVTAIDELGCSGETQIYVSSGISYSESVASIIDTNCATTGCHVAGNGIPSLTSFSSVQSNADKIKELTQNKSMPRNGSLTDAQIEAIACWVDDGALDN